MPRCAEFYTQKPARRKASPGGEAGSPQGLTDEVEAIVHHHESVQNCYLRPHPSRFWRDTFPQGKAALRRVGSLLQNPTVHPLRHLRWHLPLHAGRQRPAGGISIPRPADTSCRFPSASGAIWGNPETPGGLQRKIGPNGSFPSGGTIHGRPRCPEPPADTSSACS